MTRFYVHLIGVAFYYQYIFKKHFCTCMFIIQYLTGICYQGCSFRVYHFPMTDKSFMICSGLLYSLWLWCLMLQKIGITCLVKKPMTFIVTDMMPWILTDVEEINHDNDWIKRFEFECFLFDGVKFFNHKFCFDDDSGLSWSMDSDFGISRQCRYLEPQNWKPWLVVSRSRNLY